MLRAVQGEAVTLEVGEGHMGHVGASEHVSRLHGAMAAGQTLSPGHTEMISNFKQSSEIMSHLELAPVSNLVAMSEEVAGREGGVSGSRAPTDFLQL